MKTTTDKEITQEKQITLMRHRQYNSLLEDGTRILQIQLSKQEKLTDDIQEAVKDYHSHNNIGRTSVGINWGAVALVGAMLGIVVAMVVVTPSIIEICK